MHWGRNALDAAEEFIDREKSLLNMIRDFKIQRRGRQRERQKKTNWFNKQNNNFARASRFFVHFFAVFVRLRRENA